MPDLLIELFSEEIPARMQARAARGPQGAGHQRPCRGRPDLCLGRRLLDPRRLTLAVEGLAAESPARARGAQGPPRRRPGKGARRLPALDRPLARAAGTARRQEGAGLVRRDRTPRPRRARDRGRGAGSHDPQLPLAQVDALGQRHPALGAPAPLHPLPPDRRPRRRSGAADGRGDRRRRHHPRPPLPRPRPLRRRPPSRTTPRSCAAPMSCSTPRSAPPPSCKAPQNLAFAAGMELVEDTGLLTELAGLVEWPVPLMGRIAPGIPAPAARGAADLDEGTPEVLLGEKPRHRPDRGLRHRRQHRDRRSRRDDPAGQPEGAVRPPLRRAVLLGERPARRQGGHGRMARRAGAT